MGIPTPSRIGGLRGIALAAGLMMSSPALANVHLLLERDVDTTGGADLFLIGYASQAAFLTNTNFTATALPQDIAPDFSAGGLTVDATGAWHLLLERDIDTTGGAELFLISYASQAAFLTHSGAAVTALPQDIAPDFSAGGLTVDATGAWHLLLERDIDTTGGAELFLISYASQAAFLTHSGAAVTALPQDIAPNFSAGGLHFDMPPAPPPPPHDVPEPASLPMLALGLLMLGAAARMARHPKPARAPL